MPIIDAIFKTTNSISSVYKLEFKAQVQRALSTHLLFCLELLMTMPQCLDARCANLNVHLGIGDLRDLT